MENAPCNPEGDKRPNQPLEDKGQYRPINEKAIPSNYTDFAAMDPASDDFYNPIDANLNTEDYPPNDGSSEPTDGDHTTPEATSSAPSAINFTYNNYYVTPNCCDDSERPKQSIPKFNFTTFVQGIELGKNGPCKKCPRPSEEFTNWIAEELIPNLNLSTNRKTLNRLLQRVFKLYPEARNIINESYKKLLADADETITGEQALCALIGAASSLVTGIFAGAKLGVFTLYKPK